MKTITKNFHVSFSGNVDVTDPGYSRDTWCRHEVDVVPGIYNASVRFNNEDGRISSLKIRHSSLKRDPRACERCFNIGVDSGLAGFFESKPDYSDAVWDAVVDRLADLTSGWHSPVFTRCEPTDPEGCNGVYCSSGYGDGSYPVYCHLNVDGLADFVEILF